MTPDEAIQAVADQSTIRLLTGQGEEWAVGKMVAYSVVPSVLIETEDGERISWRHDMAELVGEE